MAKLKLPGGGHKNAKTGTDEHGEAGPPSGKRTPSDESAIHEMPDPECESED